MIVLALLDLPTDAVLSLDGHKVMLKREDFVGFVDLPKDILHLISVQVESLTTAVLLHNESVVLRYNPQLEEMQCVEDTLTCQNLLAQMPELPPPSVLPYKAFLNESQQHSWRDQTKYITPHILQELSAPIGRPLFDLSFPPVPLLHDSRYLRHENTKRFLRSLPPHERTDHLRNPQRAWEPYQSNWTGQLQLSFILFMYTNHADALEHWRDLFVLVSAHATDEPLVLSIFPNQLSTMDEVWEESFVSEALRHVFRRFQTPEMQEWQRELTQQFPELDLNGSRTKPMSDDDSVSSDAPVVVDESEITASVRRNQERPVWHMPERELLQNRYPLLLAALDDEDVLMACARILDEKKDVSLVREAAAYLEEIEQFRVVE